MSYHEGRIFIQDPRTNIDPYRRFTSPGHLGEEFNVRSDSEQDNIFTKLVDSGTIGPEKYPRALDLYAGDGSWARRFVEHGWDPQNVTCIDRDRTETPLVPEARWIYMDLFYLAEFLREHYRLPAGAEALRHRWDLVASSYGAIVAKDPRADQLLLAQFFVRKKGAMIVERDFSVKKDGRLPR